MRFRTLFLGVAFAALTLASIGFFYAGYTVTQSKVFNIPTTADSLPVLTRQMTRTSSSIPGVGPLPSPGAGARPTVSVSKLSASTAAPIDWRVQYASISAQKTRLVGVYDALHASVYGVSCLLAGMPNIRHRMVFRDALLQAMIAQDYPRLANMVKLSLTMTGTRVNMQTGEEPGKIPSEHPGVFVTSTDDNSEQMRFAHITASIRAVTQPTIAHATADRISHLPLGVPAATGGGGGAVRSNTGEYVKGARSVCGESFSVAPPSPSNTMPHHTSFGASDIPALVLIALDMYTTEAHDISLLGQVAEKLPSVLQFIRNRVDPTTGLFVDVTSTTPWQIPYAHHDSFIRQEQQPIPAATSRKSFLLQQAAYIRALHAALRLDKVWGHAQDSQSAAHAGIFDDVSRTSYAALQKKMKTALDAHFVVRSSATDTLSLVPVVSVGQQPTVSNTATASSDSLQALWFLSDHGGLLTEASILSLSKSLVTPFGFAQNTIDPTTLVVRPIVQAMVHQAAVKLNMPQVAAIAERMKAVLEANLGSLPQSKRMQTSKTVDTLLPEAFLFVRPVSQHAGAQQAHLRGDAAHANVASLSALDLLAQGEATWGGCQTSAASAGAATYFTTKLSAFVPPQVSHVPDTPNSPTVVLSSLSSVCEHHPRVLRGLNIRTVAQYCGTRSTDLLAATPLSTIRQDVLASSTSPVSTALRFSCDRGTNSISPMQLNDEFCDCQDGSDEPGTSACSGAIDISLVTGHGTHFTCFQHRSNPHDEKNSAVPVSCVDDGICDCSDCSDEVHPPPVTGFKSLLGIFG
jgi:hypothetical protein